MAVTYRYRVAPRTVAYLHRGRAAVAGGPRRPALVKESKVGERSRSAYEAVDVYGSAGKLHAESISAPSEPWTKTAQVTARDRRRVGFTGTSPLAITMISAMIIGYVHLMGARTGGQAAARAPSLRDSA